MIFKTSRFVSAGFVALLLAWPSLAQEQGSKDHSHDQASAHSDATAMADDAIYRGYFADSQIANRELSDWQGSWQSVYPLLQDGALDRVLEAKSRSGDKTAEEYRGYYETGYRTDVAKIDIEGDAVTFHGPAGAISAQYASDGYEILNYKKGNRGVRFIFRKTTGDAQAPEFIQFSDHAIAPVKAGHYHLYWGNDREKLLSELSNWPTYYPASMTPAQIVEEMLAH